MWLKDRKSHHHNLQNVEQVDLRKKPAYALKTPHGVVLSFFFGRSIRIMLPKVIETSQ